MKNSSTKTPESQARAQLRKEMEAMARKNEKLLAEELVKKPEKAKQVVGLIPEAPSITVAPGDPAGYAGNNPGVLLEETLPGGAVVRFEYKMLNTSLLKTNEVYQLPLNMARVALILKNFNPLLVNPIKVSWKGEYGDKVDGQHTCYALITRNGGKDLDVVCKVYYDLTVEQDAWLFSQQSGVTRQPSFLAKMNALTLAEDSEMVGFRKATEDAGFQLMESASTNGPTEWRIRCPKKAYQAYTRLGAEKYFEMMCVIGAWACGSSQSVCKELLGGFCEFFQQYHGTFSRQRLMQALTGISPDQLLQKCAPNIRKMDKKYAYGIVELYNYRLRDGARLDEMKLLK